ncbi:hypothetical protein [Pyxidicoccus xibeiensis]|uniref:hypothetical protein n=1 Tax=Pyxidicoccus xibeiensis TaxID=2906759 RepID=UPI0020A76697|nr:hypothetical protein [Pyxidicoccus xibeiensis]MCP3138921.1 hypothetical protein [Pyxidicoccus xibeiensis]
MVLRVLALAAFVSVVGVGCGGGELPEGAESGAPVQEETSASAARTCEYYQGKACNPDREIGCTFANGTPGYCFCQAIPHNNWVCLAD